MYKANNFFLQMLNIQSPDNITKLVILVPDCTIIEIPFSSNTAIAQTSFHYTQPKMQVAQSVVDSDPRQVP